LMWVAWYHMFHCSNTVCLVPDHVATLRPVALLLSHDITADVSHSFVACAITVTLISCLQCHNLVTALYVIQSIFLLPLTDKAWSQVYI
jgi:hypothetical protein